MKSQFISLTILTIVAQQTGADHYGMERFRIKLANSIAQSWSFLPFRSVEALDYKLYVSKKGYIAAVSSHGHQDTLYWADHPNERYLYIIPSQHLKLSGDSLVVSGERYELVEVWSNAVPAID